MKEQNLLLEEENEIFLGGSQNLMMKKEFLQLCVLHQEQQPRVQGEKNSLRKYLRRKDANWL